MPGAKAAVAVTENGRIGVIGTQATIDSKAYEREIHQIDPDIKVVATSCPLFVPLAEEGWLEGDVPELIAKQYLTPLTSSGIDTLILGCTHYPILKPLLSNMLGASIQLVDSAEETTREVESVLKDYELLSESSRRERRFYVSDLPRRFEILGERFLGYPIEDVAIAEPWKHVSPSQVP